MSRAPAAAPLAPNLRRLRRVLAETLVRSGLDANDDLLLLTAFLHDFRWRDRSATAAELAREWTDLLASPPPGHFLNLYLHFPYCGRKCLFCLYASRVPPRRAAIASYVEGMRAETAFFARAARGARLRTFAAGGGTPSLLSPVELERFYEPVFDAFALEDDAFVSVECNPASTDAEKLRVLRRLGFARASFGVQSLDARVLASVRREYQTETMVARAVSGARDAGFEDVNLDLLFGLLDDTTESFLASFRRAARLRPTTIQVCGLSLTDAYLRANRTTREDFARHYAGALPAALAGLRREAAEAGYLPDGLTPDKGVWAFVAAETPRALFRKWRRKEVHSASPSSVLGLGAASRSHAYGRSMSVRGDGAFDPDAPLYRRAPLTMKEEMALFLLYAFETSGYVPARAFRARFGATLDDALGFELRALEALGALSREARGARFLPSTPASRVFHGLVLLLDTARESPFSAGRIDDALLAGVRAELEAVHG